MQCYRAVTFPAQAEVLLLIFTGSLYQNLPDSLSILDHTVFSGSTDESSIFDLQACDVLGNAIQKIVAPRVAISQE
jgi:hypothetical protein